MPVARLVLASAEERMADLAFEPLLSVKTGRSLKNDVYEIFGQVQLARADRGE